MEELDYFKKEHSDKELQERYFKYAHDVLDGKITACEYLKLCCKRYLNFFQKEEYYFDAQNVFRVEKFLSHLKHSTGKFGQKPFILMEWQRFALAMIFGWKYKDSQLRVTRCVSLCVARKNGKTSFFAGIMLYCLIADGESQASCLLAANSAAQAQICFDMCSNYLKSIDPDNKHFKRYRQIIKYGNSKIKVCPAIADRLDGENASVFIEDECHAAPSSAVYDVLVSSQGMRSQPLAMVCSTRGFNLSSWYYSWDSDMIDILQGVKEDDSVFPLIYTLDEGDDYHDEKVWVKASPSLDVTVTKEYLRQMVRRADNDPQQLSNVLTKLMNMWCASSNAWIPMQNVMKCFDKVSLNDYKDTYCIIGLDLASVSDLTALTVMLPMEDGFVFKNFYFFPREQLKYSQNAALYKSAEKNGDLIITEGNVCDYDYVKDLILKINAICPVQTIAYDQWNSSAFIISLQKEGFSNCLKPFSQSIQSFNKPVKDLNRRILLGQVKIDKNILTRFCFQNAKLYIDANENYKIIKESAEQKIDGIVSMCDALGSYLDENDIPLQVDTINF